MNTPTDILTELQNHAATLPPGQPIAQGSFAIFAVPTGGFMFAANIPDGPYAGEYKRHVTPQIIKLANAFFKLMSKKLKG